MANQNLVAQRDDALEQRRAVDAELTTLEHAGFGHHETAAILWARWKELTEVITRCNVALSREKYRKD